MDFKDIIKISNTTQNFVPIKEIRNGVAVLKDGSLRSLVMVSSVNFGLKSNDERAAIISEFQNFLNSLDFSLQIFIQSRRLDIRPYLTILEQRKLDQTNELLKVQIKEYIEFIRFFTDTHNVMTKNFFVVIPYTPPILNTRKGGFLSGLMGRNDNSSASEIANSNFEENVAQLNQRVNVVRGGLSRVGLRNEPLETEELIELYFKIFNPGEAGTPTTEESKAEQKVPEAKR
ncbi:MAG: hypothetical protein WC640_00660 [Candidatus Paceibacterota bacterium]|jgi:hypothetical protein